MKDAKSKSSIGKPGLYHSLYPKPNQIFLAYLPKLVENFLLVGTITNMVGWLVGFVLFAFLTEHGRA